MKGQELVVGVLVQANYGSREDLMVAGVPVGEEIDEFMPRFREPARGDGGLGSIIVVVATNAPLLPHQLKRIARRVPMGISRVGGFASNGSGDLFIAFSTANESAFQRSQTARLTMLPNDELTPLFLATIQATEEAIINALIAAESMEGVNGNTVYALPHDELRSVLRKYNRLNLPTVDH